MKIRFSYAFLLLFSFFFSCEKVIEIDLDDQAPRLVIEASLIGGDHDFIVNISESTPYFEVGSPSYINDAKVVLKTEDGQEIALNFEGNGRYAKRVNALPNSWYTLEVTLGEITYQANSYLPAKIELEELVTVYQPSAGPREEGYQIFLRFFDPAGTANYYRVVHSINGVLQASGNDLQASADDLFDGAYARLPLFNKVFELGDTVLLELRHFDAASYDYFNSLSDIVSSDGGPNGGSAAPGNPNTNWSADILGYFSAYQPDTLSILIE